MLIFRLIFGLLLLAGVLCFAMYIATGHPTWKRNGIVIVKWTVLAALALQSGADGGRSGTVDPA